MQITQKQAIERGATHFIEQYRLIRNENDFEHTPKQNIEDLEENIDFTKKCPNLTTVAIFLIKPKKK